MGPAMELGHGLAGPGCGFDPPAMAQKAGFKRGAHAGIVIDHEHLGEGRMIGSSSVHAYSPVRGNSKVKAVPCPRELATRMLPWCCCMTVLHTARPRPGL